MSCLVNYSDSSDEDDGETKEASSDEEEIGRVGMECEKKLNSNSNSRQTQTEHDRNRTDCLENTAEENETKRQRLDDSVLLQTSVEKRADCNDNGKLLTLPPAIQSMFSRRTAGQWNDDPALHGNRKRSFPHVEGNWATHVFIPVSRDERLVSFVNWMLHLLKPLDFEMLPDFHVSLSRTVTIRHHWIDPLVSCLKDKFLSIKSCVGDLCDVRLYANDEKTRTFLCLEVSEEDTNFLQYVSLVDKCFSEFKLPVYYENPSFHISVAWCLGDVSSSVPKEKLQRARENLASFCADHPELSVVFAKDVCCRSGNKSFTIPLLV